MQRSWPELKYKCGICLEGTILNRFPFKNRTENPCLAHVRSVTPCAKLHEIHLYRPVLNCFVPSEGFINVYKLLISTNHI